MSAPTPAPGDDRPREGYYPDPSIPGYVRYWNGASWVAGTSRPAPEDGEPLAPPPGARPSVEETGPHFFDEDPVEESPGAASQHGSRPEPATAWGADRSQQPGFPGTPEQRVAWPGTARGTDPRVPHARQAGPADPTDSGAAPGDPRAGIAGAGTAGSGAGEGRGPGGPARAASADSAGPAGAVGSAGGGGSAQDGRGSVRRPGGPARAASADSAGSAEAGGSAQDGRGPGRDRGVPARTAPAGAAGPAGGGGPVQDDAASGAARADASAGATSGEAEAQAGDTFVFRRPTAGPQSAPAAEDEGTMTFRAVTPRTGAQPGGPASGPGFGAGKAAAARAAGAQPPAAPAAPGVPHQGQAPAPAPQPATSAPVAAAGSGGGQSSWAQQVHRLAGAGGDEQPVAPWKPPVEDVFQAAARRQAAARPAGLGKRLAARLIDTVVLAGVTAVAAVPLGVKAADHVNDKIDQAKLSGETVTVWLLDGTTSTYLGIVLAVLLLFGVVYEALPTAKWGRTLGKRLLGLEVRDIEAHEPPSFGAALRRWLVYSVPGLLVVGVVGVAWCLFDRPWRQCWHDKAAATFVAG
ncbi:RDD family protein [Streptomyces sp. BBFR51]|uniref:RDD family protein n=1 Tax=Streptomyces sp. BBFR51 TaxID=3372856 RepID=UPI0037DD7254